MTTPEDTTPTTDDTELTLNAETLDDLDPKHQASELLGGAAKGTNGANARGC